jgi:lipopolysaccharide export system protein LptA
MSKTFEKPYLSLLSALILFLAVLAPAAAQDGEAASDSVSAESTGENQNISFAGNFTQASIKEGSRTISLSGGAWVDSGNVYVEADSIDIYGEQSRFLSCQGNVILTQKEEEITLQANVLDYDRESSSLTVNGWVELLDRKNQLAARGAYLRSEEDTGIILIQVNVSILKTDDEDSELYCRADSAIFDTNANMLELTGRSEVSYDGSFYKASRILIDLDTNEITMEGGVSGNIDESQ